MSSYLRNFQNFLDCIVEHWIKKTHQIIFNLIALSIFSSFSLLNLNLFYILSLNVNWMLIYINFSQVDIYLKGEINKYNFPTSILRIWSHSLFRAQSHKSLPLVNELKHIFARCTSLGHDWFRAPNKNHFRPLYIHWGTVQIWWLPFKRKKNIILYVQEVLTHFV